eukprot:2319084-Rhodomonas_salina.1
MCFCVSCERVSGLNRPAFALGVRCWCWSARICGRVLFLVGFLTLSALVCRVGVNLVVVVVVGVEAGATT